MNSLKNSKSKYHNKNLRLLIIIFIGLFITYYFNNINKNKNNNIVYKSKIELSKPKFNSIPTIKNKDVNPSIDARYWALYDIESSSMIIGKNYDSKVPIASITKIMTAIIVLEQSKIDEVVTIPKIAVNVSGSKILLKSDEKITVEGLLQGSLINSGNDAAYSLGYYIADKFKPEITPEEKINFFVDLMNKKAEELGLLNTRYFDPAGLDDNGKSTVRDQGILITYVLNNQTIASIINKPEATIYSVDGTIEHKLENSNRLVKEEMYYMGIIGGKTGFTPVAGHNLVAAARRDEHILIAIIISTYSNLNTASATEAKKLLDWGFNNLIWT